MYFNVDKFEFPQNYCYVKILKYIFTKIAKIIKQISTLFSGEIYET